MLGQSQCAPEGTVTANGNNAVQTQHFAGVDSLLLALFRHEFRAAGGIEHGAAPIDDMGDALFVQTHNVAVDQAVIAAADTDDLNAAEDGSTDNGTDRRVHTGCVAAAGQNTDAPHRVFAFFHYLSPRSHCSVFFSKSK